MGYRRELAACVRLREHEVLDVLGHAVPQLLDADPQLGVIELSTVAPPYVLDFAKCQLDVPLGQPPPAAPTQLAGNRERRRTRA
ncbi:MAG: hypothetical protein WD009_12205, partial [Phycisphaeraceae bacterium]